MRKKIKVSILFVYYKEKKELFSCLNSIKRAKIGLSYEIIVVDNSDTNLLEKKLDQKYPNIKYIKAPGNLGFGKGINLAAKYAKGEYLFTLNPDTKILPNTLETLVDFANKKKGKVAVAPMLVNKKLMKVPQLGSKELTPIKAIFSLSIINKIYPNNPISKSYWLETGEQKSVYKADIIPGIFLIKKSIFQELGGFDEHFFLYFEDTDFFVRLKKRKYQAFILQDSKIIHIGSVATSRQLGTGKVMAQSRFYYFKKHHGLISALIVEMFTRFSKWHAFLLGVLALSSFLLFYRIGSLMMFIGDFGWYFLSARDMILAGKFPLVGIASSVPVFKQGAVFTWLLGGALLLGKFNPVSGAYLTSAIGVITVLGIYKLTSKMFGQRVGLIASLITASSPMIIIHARMPFVTALMLPATLLVAWSFYELKEGKDIHYFLLGLFLAILFQLEIAGFILIPVIALTFIWQKIEINKLPRAKSPRFLKESLFTASIHPRAKSPRFSGSLNKKKIAGFVLGTIIGLIPFIIWDIKQEVFIQTLGFAGWSLLKMFEGLASLFSGNFGVSNFSLSASYLERLIMPVSPIFSFSFALASLGLFTARIIKLKHKAGFSRKFIILWIFVALFGFAVRGIVSEAYVPLLFFPWIIISALFIEDIIKRTKLGWVFLFVLVFINANFLIRNDYLMPKVYGVPYSEREEAAEFIINDAMGEPYDLVYVGPGNEFVASDNNYRYLLWWKGNEPVAGTDLIYVVFDPKNSFRGKFERVREFKSIIVGVINI